MLALIFVVRTLGLAVLCFLVTGVTEVSAHHGDLVGHVADETGGILPSVPVELLVSSTGDLRHAVTDEKGYYRFENVPHGPVVVTLRLINFSTFRRELHISVEDKETIVDIVLTLGMTADVVVTGTRTFRNVADLDDPRENLVGIASSASVGAVTMEHLQSRPIMRPGEALESVPGMIVSQHSGEGKANQFYLRGFNLDHGSDFSTAIDGVPTNESSGAHAHGYSDLNVLIPELVSGIQYTKGPYFAEHGDFSVAGSANVRLISQLDAPILSVSAGGQGWGRVFGAASPEVGSGNLLVALELGKNNGPWESPDEMRKVNSVVRYSQGDRRNGFSITGMFYSANWNATDQIPQRAVTEGLISRYGTIDSSDAGRTYRRTLSLDLLRSGVKQTTRITAYALRGQLNLFQNFTYFLDHPVDGDQVEQEGSRWMSGGQVVHRRLGYLGRFPIESTAGISLRNDAIGTVGLYNTIRRTRVNTIRDDRVHQTTVGVFGQTEIEWSSKLRTTVGVRGDGYRYAVVAKNPANSGSGTSGLVSPKVTVVMSPLSSTELYLNYGQGFHSNDPRAATTRFDPISGGAVSGAAPLVPAIGYEVGLRTVAVPRMQSTVAVWHLEFDSELVFVGDAGIAEASRPSERNGVELVNYARLTDSITVELDLALSKARFSDSAHVGNFIPGSLDRVISGGIMFSPTRRAYGGLRLRHFGPRPLVEDNSVQSAPTTIWNGEFGLHLTENLNLTVEGFNLLNSSVSDIDYYYTSRLPGEPAGGVDDIHFHPSLPRTVRLTLSSVF